MTAAAWGEYRPRGLQRAGLAVYLATRSKTLKLWLRQYLERASEVYDISRRNLKLRCHIRDNSTDQLIVFGRRTANDRELTLLEKHLRPGCVFVDVGANCGLFSLVASQKVGEEGRVIAIEPNPIMAERLRFNISANGFQNINIAECAVGDVTGTVELQVCTEQLGRSGLIAPVPGPRITVPLRTLQDVLQGFGIGQIDAMKVDIEGFEDRVIMPLLRTAPKRLLPRVILIEVIYAYLWRDSCIVALQDEGYKIEWKSRTDVLLSLSS
jgi:FkbM family methyltransferase